VARIALLVLIACGHGESPGGEIALEIQGSVFEVDDANGVLGASVGDLFTGVIAYDAEADNAGEVDSAIYRFSSARSKISIEINGILFETEPTAIDMLIGVVDRASDTLVYQSTRNRCIGCPGVEFISWQLDDSTGTALTDAALPLDPPDLSRFTQQVGLSIDGGGLGGFTLRGEVATVVELL
jgi:hypothetical protein